MSVVESRASLSVEDTTSLKLPIDIFQSHLDGMKALIHWLEGHSDHQGHIPGALELLMHYRSINVAIRKHHADRAEDLEIPIDG